MPSCAYRSRPGKTIEPFDRLRADSKHKNQTDQDFTNDQELFPYPVTRLMLTACHLPATLGAVSTCLNAVIHTADLLAIRSACFANFGANFAKTMLKMRTAELEIGRCLADLGAVHHETEMFCFNVLPASLEAMVHGGLQADLVAMSTSLYTGLHGLFSVGWMIHGILLR